MRRLGLAAALLVCLPAIAGVPKSLQLSDDTAADDPVEAFAEGDVICTKDNVTAQTRGVLALPIDIQRFSCWRYEGRSATGRAKIAVIKNTTPKPPGFDFPDLGYFEDHPIKVDAAVMAAHFIREGEVAGLKRSLFDEYRRRWSDMSEEQIGTLLRGDVFLQMPADAAEESVGWLIHKRTQKFTDAGTIEMWHVGKKSLAAQAVGEARTAVLWGMPVTPTREALARDVISMVLTFTDGRLTELERHTGAAPAH